MVEDSDAIEYICPAKISRGLENKLRGSALKAYNVLGCKDVGRFDFRVDYKNNPYFIECNPLPNLGMIDVFPLVAKATGRTYEELIRFILESALKRYNLFK
jgi:D-alanine-D-alanine ligase